MSGNDPGHWADRRRQLRAQEPAPAQAGVPDPKAFRSGRHFAAWIGITPRENSTAGKHRPGKISREGDESLRRLLVLGATAVIQQAKPGRASAWLLGLLARKPKKLAAVALANKACPGAGRGRPAASGPRWGAARPTAVRTRPEPPHPRYPAPASASAARRRTGHPDITT